MVGNSFSSVFWPSSTPSCFNDENENTYSSYSSSSSSSSSSVDCTLSLGTPSTRFLSNESNNNNNHHYYHESKQNPHRNPTVSNFCWDLLHQKQQQSSPAKSNRSTAAPSGGSGGGDPLLARRCANCDTTSTPLWRNGPRGPKSLCNACGIRFKKEERRAAAASSTAAANNTVAAGGGMMMIDHPDCHNAATYYSGGGHHYNYSPAATVAPQKMQCFGAPNEFRFMEEDDRGSQFLSWLTHDHRPSGFVHHFTR